GEFLRRLQGLKEIRADGHGLAGRLVAEAHQFAIGLIIAHGGIEVGNAVEGGGRGGFGGGRVRSIERDSEKSAHVGAGEFVTLKGGRGWGGCATRDKGCRGRGNKRERRKHARQACLVA